jgi:hypothetical protein
MVKRTHSKNQTKLTGLSTIDPNELKTLVRDGLVAMDTAHRELFIQELETEMKKLKLDIRSYLIPLGIPGRSPEDLTPTEVGHLVRYLRYNVPNAIPGVERTLERTGVVTAANHPGNRLAA